VTEPVSRRAPTRRGGSGLALAALSAATFGTSGAFASSLLAVGWSPAAAVMARITVAAAVLAIPALLQLRGRWALLRRSAGKVAAFGLLAVAGCQFFYFSAIVRMPVAVALLLEYLGTVMIVGWLWVRQGQRPRRLTIIGAVAAIAGLVCVLNVTGSAHIDSIGVLWGLLAAVGMASYYLLSATGGEAELPPLVLTWAGMCVGALALLALWVGGALTITAPARNVSFLGHRVSWLVPVLGLSIVAAVIAYVAGIGANRRLGAKLASFVGMSEVLFAIVFAWVLLGQLPTMVQFMGGALILAGVVLVRADELHGTTAPEAAVVAPPGAGQASLGEGTARRGPGRAGSVVT
jgi:drug/metabolite transporter (DMT)-like permease